MCEHMCEENVSFWKSPVAEPPQLKRSVSKYSLVSKSKRLQRLLYFLLKHEKKSLLRVWE
jgi:hypothetical protein